MNGIMFQIEKYYSLLYCDRDISSSFKNNKAPANDGLTAEFYKKQIWNLFKKQLVDCFNYSFLYGELSTTQKQAIITLITKKDKDKRFIAN
jgi:hypothetical protein